MESDHKHILVHRIKHTCIAYTYENEIMLRGKGLARGGTAKKVIIIMIRIQCT